jgi:glycosyltransferase 2 family protein
VLLLWVPCAGALAKLCRQAIRTLLLSKECDRSFSMKHIKPLLRWLIVGVTLFFFAKAFKDHWHEVSSIKINSSGWGWLAIAILTTLCAHTWSGWVWTWILQYFQQPVGRRWALQVYLKTNIFKYIPGNIWHFYGRVSAVKEAGGSLGAASLSVLLEPLLMAAGAVAIAIAGNGLGLIASTSTVDWGWQVVGLGMVLMGVHPRILNPIMQRLDKSKRNPESNQTYQLERYPFWPFLGEMGFLLLRGTGFLLTLLVLAPINFNQIPSLLSSFSFAWLLGLIVPGAPGGLGVFEATALALLGKQFSPGLLLGVLALFRMVSIVAEITAAGLAVLSENLERKD